MTDSTALAALAESAPVDLPTQSARLAAENNPVMSAVLTAADEAARTVVARSPDVAQGADRERLVQEIVDAMVARPEFQAAKPATDAVQVFSSPATWGPVVGLVGAILSGFGWQWVPEGGWSTLAAYIGGSITFAALVFALVKRWLSKAQPVVLSWTQTGSSRR